MESGAPARQLRGRHRRRRDAMTAAIGAHLPQATVHGAAALARGVLGYAASTRTDIAEGVAAVAAAVRDL